MSTLLEQFVDILSTMKPTCIFPLRSFTPSLAFTSLISRKWIKVKQDDAHCVATITNTGRAALKKLQAITADDNPPFSINELKWLGLALAQTDCLMLKLGDPTLDQLVARGFIHIDIVCHQLKLTESGHDLCNMWKEHIPEYPLADIIPSTTPLPEVDASIVRQATYASEAMF